MWRAEGARRGRALDAIHSAASSPESCRRGFRVPDRGSGNPTPLGGWDSGEIGLVESFSRPSGNLTGIYNLIAGLGPKHLEILHELLPTVSTIVSLLNPDNPNAHAYALQTQAAADALGLRLQVLTAHTEADLEAAFGTMVQQRANALLVIADPFFVARREQVVALAAGHAMPAIYPIRWFPQSGGLMSYGAAIESMYQQVGTYAGRILKGAKPADLPIEQTAKYELVINLKTAKTLSLTVPPSLLARADEVIE